MCIAALPRPKRQPSDRPGLPPLQSGDRLTRAEFERRYAAHPNLKAELIEGVVYVEKASDLTYRLIQPNEEVATVKFWSSMFECDYDEMYAEYATDLERLLHTYVAVTATGEIYSTASYCVRYIRDVNGDLQRTGCVWNVATKPQAQRQGLARRLMIIMVEAMIAEGCTWSLVFTSPDGYALYKKLGYTDVNAPFWSGPIITYQITDTAYTVRSYDPRIELDGWLCMSDIYHSYNLQRPLTTFRDTNYWISGYAHHRYMLWLAQQKVIFAAFPIGNEDVPVGYLAADFDEKFQIFEIGTMTGHEEALSLLMDSAVQTAVRKGYEYGHIWLPHNRESEKLIQPLFF